MGPELCKNSPPWQNFESFGPFFEGLISIRQNWTYFCKKLCYWGNWHSCKWPKLKNNQSIWSRWFFNTKFYTKRWDVDDSKLQKCFSQKILIDLKRCKIYFTPFYEERERELHLARIILFESERLRMSEKLNRFE